MKQILYYFSVIFLFALFILVMNSGNLFKQPSGIHDNFIYYLDEISQNISYNEWDNAIKNSEKLNLAWSKIVFRIQFSVE
ncbi:MAG: hypothetical protein ACOX6E_04065, partial [Syntrophomonadaceae bacterium]